MGQASVVQALGNRYNALLGGDVLPSKGQSLFFGFFSSRHDKINLKVE